MDLTKIMTVSGKPGLFQMVSQTKNGLLVESLLDGRKMPVFASDRVSSLEDISLFTVKEDMPLKDVLNILFKKLDGKKAIDAKSDKKELIAFMDEHLPDWDNERVYPSDVKKLISWYNLLIEHNLISAEEEKKTVEEKKELVEEKKEKKVKADDKAKVKTKNTAKDKAKK